MFILNIVKILFVLYDKVKNILYLITYSKEELCRGNFLSRVSYRSVASKRKITRNVKEEETIQNFIRVVARKLNARAREE